MERVLLVIIKSNDRKQWETEDLTNELCELTRSSGAVVCGEAVCHRDKPNPAYFIGRGKVEEISLLSRQLKADVVIFNEDLSSTQQRNLEEVIDLKVIDRTQLILDIFAQRSRSQEGNIQVELAQLEYLLPRLTGKGIILSRLGGGIGTRGPGEQKLETDKRRIKKRIIKLKRDLQAVETRRLALRKRREDLCLATIAIIGYTNGGKSTLLNSLTKSQVVVKDQLFSTLDSTTRKFLLPNNQKVLFTDTVGFLHKLPHHLIEAFKATLEEVVEADLLLHVLDVSHPVVYHQDQAVYEVLKEIGAAGKPMITALNKIDKLENRFSLERFRKNFTDSVPISALKMENFEQLIDRITARLACLVIDIRVLVPQNRMDLVNIIYNQGQVSKKECRDNGIYIEAQLPTVIAKKVLTNL